MNEATNKTKTTIEVLDIADAKMNSFDFTGLENAEDSQTEKEGKEIDFILVRQGEIQRGSNATPQQRFLYRAISSGSMLKSIASAAGLWTGSKLWSFASILITLPMIIFVLTGESVVVFFCKQSTNHFNDTFCRKTRGYSFHLSAGEYQVYEFLRFLAVTAQVCCLLTMSISVQRSSYKSQALSIEEAYKLVKPKTWIVVNIQMIGFFILLTTSNLLNFCCSSQGKCSNCDPFGAMFYAMLSIVLWLTVIACLVHATVINGAIAQAEQGNSLIIEMEGGTVNDAIEIHQRFCKIGMHTIKIFHAWFLLNSACYFWLIVYMVVVFLTQTWQLQSWFIFYHMSVCGLYAVFAFLHPWITAANLTRTYSKLTRKLNTTFQWKPGHLFSDRTKLDSFILYASNTQCQFSQITCSSSLPYISLFLALCGLGLRFFQ